MINTQQEYPRVVYFLTRVGFQAGFTLVALILILVFDASVFIFRPYDGLVFDSYAFTVVTSVDKGSPAEKAGVLPGDELLSVDGKLVDRWLSRPLYQPGIRAGDTVSYQVQRNNQTLTLFATVSGFFTSSSFFGSILGLQILSVAFWSIGFCLCLFVPHDHVQARLAGLVWLLTGIAVAAGGPAGVSYFWGSGIAMKFAWAALGFLLVTLHTIFPTPIVSTLKRNRIIYSFTVLAFVLVVVTIVDDAVFKNYFHIYTGLAMLVYGFFAFSVLISLGFLMRSFFRSVDPDYKRQTGIVLWGMALGFLPFLVLTLLPLFLHLNYLDGGYKSLFLVLIPLAYTYVILQRKLLKVDFIINRLVVFFVMGLLVLTTSFLTLVIISTAMNLPSSVAIVGSIMAVTVALLSAGLREKANRWVSRTLYGAYYDHASVAGSLSSCLAQALDRDTLVNLLTVGLGKQMGIQKTALFLMEGDNLSLQTLKENDAFSVSLDDVLCRFLLDAQAPVRGQNLWNLLFRNTQGNWQRFVWGELFVPIIFENHLHGILILGARVAGDIYSDQDVHIISTVAHQGALAAVNVQLVETLRGLSQQLVRAGEDERKQVVRDLHDGVLQNLFFIKQKIRQNPEAVGYLGDVITTLRSILRAQRPFSLDLGLAPALDELVTNMNKLVGEGGPQIVLRGAEVNIHLPDEHATAIYRIAQESIANAMRHAQARNIIVSFSKDNDTLSLTVEDDGVGMPRIMVSDGRYGLIGMRERALMIGANLHILSNCGEGTKIRLEYKLC